jgi:hypothetical protein
LVQGIIIRPILETDAEHVARLLKATGCFRHIAAEEPSDTQLRILTLFAASSDRVSAEFVFCCKSSTCLRAKPSNGRPYELERSATGHRPIS